MNTQKLRLVLISLTFLAALPALGDYEQRLSLGVGAATTNSETSFDVGAEYEYRLHPLLGVGAFGNYIFSNPSITYVGFPEVFFHPFTTDFLVSASPVMETGSGLGTHFGTRLGTRIPLPFGPITIVPTFAIDFINGGQDYFYGLGISL